MVETLKKFPRAKPLSSSKQVTMPVFIEEKIDGHRLQLCRGEAYGRSLSAEGYWINKWGSLPDKIKSKAPKIPVDGEIWWPGKEASDVATGLKDRNDELRFIGFRVCNKEMYPDEHLKMIEDMGIDTPFSLFIDYYLPLPNINSLLDMAKKRKIEGWVIKEKYKSVFKWWKLKVSKTYDVIVTGFNIGTAGRYKDRIASIRCSVYDGEDLIEIANVSGMKDNVRFNLINKDIGRVIEVEANLFASQGRLKHPRFKRWRDDKNAKECTFREMV